MRKRYFLGIVLVLFVFGVTACDHGSLGSRKIKLDQEDSGGTINLYLNDIVIVELPSNASTGFSWQNISSPESPLSQVGESVYQTGAECEGRDGCGGTETFTFKAVRTGTGEIELNYCRSWEPDNVADQFSVTVNVKNRFRGWQNP